MDIGQGRDMTLRQFEEACGLVGSLGLSYHEASRVRFACFAECEASFVKGKKMIVTDYNGNVVEWSGTRREALQAEPEKGDA